MTQNAFLTSIQQITSGALSLTEMIAGAQQLSRAGQTDYARQLYQVWINFNRDNPLLFVANFNYSTLLAQIGDDDGADAALRDALAQNPDFSPAHINLGSALERRGRAKEAVEQWKAGLDRLSSVTGDAIDYKATLLKQVSRVFMDNQQHESAEAALRQCLDLNPRQRDVAEQFAAVRLAQCKWPIAAAPPRMTSAELLTRFHPLSACAYADDPYFHLALASDYVRASSADANAKCDRRDAPIDLAGRRLRVGYVSSDLRSHAVGYLMVQLFESHDPAAIEVFAYYCGIPSEDAITQRIRGAVAHWIDIRSLSDDEAAARIAADGIDILVDVNGHTRDARLGIFARRPAPIQVNWLGYPGAMGSPFHHYIIADDWVIPERLEGHYSERVLRLPCYQPNDRKRIVAEPGQTRAAAGLPDDAFVFCSFNAAHKLTRYSFERWLEILRRTPGSVLWLLDYGADTNARLGAYASERGVEATRLIPAPKLANAHHLARYPLADLFLDTLPYGAHTTASDALWMGVPVLTLSGASFASRVCGSLVRAAGVGELVCTTAEEFVGRAVALATADRVTLRAYRERLLANRETSVLFDIEGLTRNLEQLYARMAREYGEGRLPQPDLRGLEAYLAIGAGFDHDSNEIGLLADYDGFYRDELARLDRARALPADARLRAGQTTPARTARAA
jgi:predicted O-linked N-acetylglucosamine transferase (SPINDLY family)